MKTTRTTKTTKTIVLYNKSNMFGLRQDALLIQSALKCELKDPLESVVTCDIAIHLEVPYYGWMGFAAVNILVINPEWWEEAWNSYLTQVKILVFKCTEDKERFLETHPFYGASCVIPWASLPTNQNSGQTQEMSRSALWLLGGSVNKRDAALKILPLWKDVWPSLEVYTTTPLSFPIPLPKNVSLHIEELSLEKKQTLQAKHSCHIIISSSEALSMSSLEGESYGAFLIGNSLPVYIENFKDKSYTFLTQSSLVPYKAGMRDMFLNVEETFEQGVQEFLTKYSYATKRAAIEESANRVRKFQTSVQSLVSGIPWFPFQPVKFLTDAELPKISVVTLTYNRKKFLDLAFHNILSTDYPKEKIEWVIVDDSDDPEEQASDKIIKFGRENGPLSLTYIPLAKRTIGRKRNVGIHRAENSIILFMDDDDHYPPSSFRRRVSYLLTHPWKPQITLCTTIACYDLQHGISAVNTPPWNLGLSKRVSEATFTFYKSFWETKNFSNVNIAEGDDFLEGRETESTILELPPQQIIVAMSHGKNSTSRRFPTGGSPSCFWGFPKEFLIFLHKLIDVEVEAS